MFTARATHPELADLSRRLATSIEAGLDIRKMWEREATGRASAAMRRRLQIISDGAARGETLVDSLNETGGYFPPLFRELVEVGEESGKLSQIFRELSRHYELQVRLRRDFIQSITWPAMQLVISILVVALLIWILGLIGESNGSPVDILGFGLVGTSGLIKYFTFVFVIGGIIAALVIAIREGALWTRPLQRLLLRLPIVGSAFLTLALSRLSWTLAITLEAGMDIKRVIPLALRSAGNARFTDDQEQILSDVRAGEELSVALQSTGAYPREFLDMLEVGERSGRIPESMAHIAADYQDRARRALELLTRIAGFLVWAGVAVLIAMVILRIGMFYIGMINDAVNMR